jgi:hypothetical protein
VGGAERRKSASLSGTVDDDDRLVQLLLADEAQHPAEQVEPLVDDRDHHADGGVGRERSMAGSGGRTGL